MRFPVKSMLGEQVDRLVVDERGCAGVRMWAVRTAEGQSGSGKSTRRFAKVPGLLDLRASERDGRIIITFPDGDGCAVEDPATVERLSRYLGRPVTLARETTVPHFDD